LLREQISMVVEAVVRLLDPGAPHVAAVAGATGLGGREALLPAVSATLRDLCDAYPMVSAHEGAQRLAVGSADGFVVLFDLRTATRLYVLEVRRTLRVPFSVGRSVPVAEWSGVGPWALRGTRPV
jgi:hypothetical protein